ncbi:hypothetical protein [Nocardioides zeae]|jgi:hypothetical protein|uniref:Uncharacterized protein n=1 Tax=Nocardioides zeae TaxID=1457234 RepID=A0A6P0HIV9_9ACTN|nr:hypothetical protein [Nocardioides zeae]NEN78496.1 hypothetical protein [Nocardioides zeae]
MAKMEISLDGRVFTVRGTDAELGTQLRVVNQNFVSDGGTWMTFDVGAATEHIRWIPRTASVAVWFDDPAPWRDPSTRG